MLVVSGLHELVNEICGGGEANREAFLAGGETKAEGDMSLAGAAGAKCNHVLAALDYRPPAEFEANLPPFGAAARRPQTALTMTCP